MAITTISRLWVAAATRWFSNWEMVSQIMVQQVEKHLFFFFSHNEEINHDRLDSFQKNKNKNKEAKKKNKKKQERKKQTNKEGKKQGN